MKIQNEILDKINKLEDERITENIDKVYEYLSTNAPCNVKKNINKNMYTSYWLKHQLQRILGVYVSNLDIKYCMELLEIKSDKSDINYSYPLKLKWLKELSKAEIKEGDYY